MVMVSRLIAVPVVALSKRHTTKVTALALMTPQNALAMLTMVLRQSFEQRL
jgi:hypothetical protein